MNSSSLTLPLSPVQSSRSSSDVVVFDYDDYHAFLRDWVESRRQKRDSYSFQELANRAGLKSRSSLRLVAVGSRKLQSSSAVLLARAMKLDEQQTEYFLALVGYNNATTPVEGDTFLRRMKSVVRPAKEAALSAQQYDLFRNWYILPVWELVACRPFTGDYEELGKAISPCITADEARSALDILIGLDLVEPAGDRFTQKQSVLLTRNSIASPTIRCYQKQSLGYETAAAAVPAGTGLTVPPPSYSGRITQSSEQYGIDQNVTDQAAAAGSEGVKLSNYYYDPAGRMTQVDGYTGKSLVRNAGGVVTNATWSNKPILSASYVYDDNDRIRVANVGGSGASAAYTYKSGTNLLDHVTGWFKAGSTRDAKAEGNFKYDSSGNLSVDNSKSKVMTWDPTGLLASAYVAAPGSKVGTYLWPLYDADDMIVSSLYKTSRLVPIFDGDLDLVSVIKATRQTGAIHYVRMAGSTQKELRESWNWGNLTGSTTIVNIHGISSVIGRKIAGNAQYFLKNHQGSTIRVVDNAGRTVSSYDYLAYGDMRTLRSQNPEVTEKYTGKGFDEVTGLYYFGARWYDAELGVWISPDPAHQFSSPYGYGTNPVNMVDEDGQFIHIIVGAIIGAAVGGYEAYKHGYDLTDWQTYVYVGGGAAIGAGAAATGGAAIAAYQAGGAAAAAVVTSASVGGAGGVYYGGSKANNNWNPKDWDYTSGKTWGYMAGGAVMGATIGAGSAGLGVAAAGGLGLSASATGWGAIGYGATYGAVSGAAAGGANAYVFGGGKDKGFFEGSTTDVLTGIAIGAGAGAVLGAGSGYLRGHAASTSKSVVGLAFKSASGATPALSNGANGGIVDVSELYNGATYLLSGLFETGALAGVATQSASLIDIYNQNGGGIPKFSVDVASWGTRTTVPTCGRGQVQDPDGTCHDRGDFPNHPTPIGFVF